MLKDEKIVTFFFLISYQNPTVLSLQPQEFWKHIANSQVEWAQPFQQTMDCDMIEAKFQWFLGGTLNASGENFLFK